jgi:lysophospholipase L1-like esterase
MIRICLLLLWSLTACAQHAFYVKDGDTVLFYGDSITDQRLYTTFVETYTVTRFPKMTVRFVHKGWGGDRVTGGGGGTIDVRLKRDVLPYKPTVMTIMLGMNDGRSRAFDEEIFKTYADGYHNIVKTLKTAIPNLRLTLIEPSPFDDVTRAPNFPGGYNAVLVRYGEFLKVLAMEEKVQVADMNTPVVQEFAKAKALDDQLSQRLSPDRVHPGASGHLLMAKALLKAWNAPSVVTTVEISQGRPRATNSTIRELKFGETVTWSQLDQALPMPVDLKDAPTGLAIKASDFEQSLDQQTLRVSGLKHTSYQLLIDDQPVGTFSSQQLASGVNLALLDTPMSRQAADVHQLTLKRANIHNTRWRVLEVPLANDGFQHNADAMKALDRLEEEIAARQRETAQPKLRRYVLKPAGN